MPLVGLCQNVTKQEIAKDTEDKGILYRNARSFGLVVHSAGWGGEFRRYKNKTGYKKRIIGFDIVGMHNPKEEKIKNSAYSNSKGFVYGKMNALTVIRPEYGFEKIIYGKEIPSALQISYLLTFGPNFTFAKPVYLEIINKGSSPGQDQITVEQYNPEKHTVYQIYGKAPFAAGLDKLKIYPGGFLKTGFNFDYSSTDDGIRSLETGIIVDAYPQPVTLMAFQKKKYYFFNVYVALSIGRKWY